MNEARDFGHGVNLSSSPMHPPNVNGSSNEQDDPNVVISGFGDAVDDGNDRSRLLTGNLSDEGGSNRNELQRNGRSNSVSDNRQYKHFNKMTTIPAASLSIFVSFVMTSLVSGSML